MGEVRNASRILVEKSERKKDIWRLWHRYADKIKLCVKGSVCEDVDCIHQGQNREQ